MDRVDLEAQSENIDLENAVNLDTQLDEDVIELEGSDLNKPLKKKRLKSKVREFFDVFPLGPNKKLKSVCKKCGNQYLAFSKYETELLPFKKFCLNELQDATGDFNPTNVIGSGGYGEVFQGTLTDGRQVAIKKLYNYEPPTFEDEIEFLSEVTHPNIVELVGFCTEGDNQLIVLEYMEKRSLQQALCGNNKLELNWRVRFKICLDVAKGLAYLHEELQMQCVVHSDVKLPNILLNSNFTAKISDFGAAKGFPKEVNHVTTSNLAVTLYIAREVKNDVYSYGAVILHLLTGGELYYKEEELISRAWKLFDENRENCDVRKLLDPSLSEVVEVEVKQALRVAILCTQADPFHRPKMSEVKQYLTGKKEVTFNASIRPPFMDTISMVGALAA